MYKYFSKPMIKMLINVIMAISILRVASSTIELGVAIHDGIKVDRATIEYSSENGNYYDAEVDRIEKEIFNNSILLSINSAIIVNLIGVNINLQKIETKNKSKI